MQQTDFFVRELRVLEIGPMPGLQRRLERISHLRYVTADRFAPFVNVRIDITSLPFADETFDCVLCYHVLQQVVDEKKALHELQRVLRPNGWAILQCAVDNDLEITWEPKAWTGPDEAAQMTGDSKAVRKYGRDYATRLGKGGFKVVVDDFARMLPRKDVMRFGIDADELIHLCIKQTGETGHEGLRGASGLDA